MENARRGRSRRGAFIIWSPKCSVICYLHIIRARCLRVVIRPDRPHRVAINARSIIFQRLARALVSRPFDKQRARVRGYAGKREATKQAAKREREREREKRRAIGAFCRRIVLHKLKVAICARVALNFLGESIDQSGGNRVTITRARARVVFGAASADVEKHLMPRNEMMVLYAPFFRCRILRGTRRQILPFDTQRPIGGNLFSENSAFAAV